MTTDSRDDADPALKPQVLDLAAEDVTPEPDAEAPETSPPPQLRNAKKSSAWILAALIVGLLAGAWLYRDVLSSYFPTDRMQGLQARVETIEANAKNTGEQLLAVSTNADQARQIASSLEAAVKDATNAQSGLTERLAALEQSLQGAKAEFDTLRNAVTAGSAGGGTTDSAALAAIGQRLDALEKDMASLKAGSGTGEGASAVNALRQSLSDMRAKIAAGTPYRQELDRVLQMVPAVGGNDVLNAYAGEGLPNAQGLAAELRNDIPTLPQPAADTSAAGDGYWDGFWGAMSSVVTIRDIGQTDWPVLAENAAKLSETGDLAQAIAQIDAAEGEMPSAIARWRDRAAARLKLDAAVEDMAKAVNLVNTARGGGQ